VEISSRWEIFSVEKKKNDEYFLNIKFLKQNKKKVATIFSIIKEKNKFFSWKKFSKSQIRRNETSEVQSLFRSLKRPQEGILGESTMSLNSLISRKEVLFIDFSVMSLSPSNVGNLPCILQGSVINGFWSRNGEVLIRNGSLRSCFYDTRRNDG